MMHSMFMLIAVALALISFLVFSHSASRRSQALWLDLTSSLYRVLISSAKCSANNQSKSLPPTFRSDALAKTYGEKEETVLAGIETN